MLFAAFRNCMALIRCKSRLLLRETMSSVCKYSDYSGFAKALNEAGKIVALTGAGVSSESGIPTFRGQGGWWRKYNCMELATPQAFHANPALVWEFYHYRRTVAFQSEPNLAHKAMAAFEKRCNEQGKSFHIITQNIDGLHQKAGSENVLELHGSLRKILCTNRKCQTIADNLDQPICPALSGRGDPNDKQPDLPIIPVSDLPKCKECGSLARPYIVWFGEHLDVEVMYRTNQLVDDCDLLLLIGTSSVVYPAAGLAPECAERGKPVAEFNVTDEPAADNFKFFFSGKCGTTLPRALQVNVV